MLYSEEKYIMKKIISAILCFVIALFTFVSCTDDVIGDIPEGLKPPVEKEKLTLNLHIICEDVTSKNAQITVAQRIADYTEEKYSTRVNIKYSYASTYEADLEQALNNGTADIVLLNSKSLADKLHEEKKLAELSAYISGNEYGMLNAKIASSLLKAYSTGDKIYSIPNNHVVGRYEYVVINRDIADFLAFGSEAQLKSINNDVAIADFENLVETNRALLEENNLMSSTDTVEKAVKKVFGNYEQKAEWEAKKAPQYACNVLSLPNSYDEIIGGIYSSFGIISTTKSVDRAMEILYAINTDVTLHNYLLYGIEETNYKPGENIGDPIVRITKEENESCAYYVNPLYTGDIFVSYYCVDLGWTKDVETFGNLQNHESVYVNPNANQ